MEIKAKVGFDVWLDITKFAVQSHPVYNKAPSLGIYVAGSDTPDGMVLIPVKFKRGNEWFEIIRDKNNMPKLKRNAKSPKKWDIEIKGSENCGRLLGDVIAVIHEWDCAPETTQQGKSKDAC